MKVVINKCFGGFSLSMKAQERWCQRKGRACYFFTNSATGGNTGFTRYVPVEAGDREPFMWYAFDDSNPNGKDKDVEWWRTHHMHCRDIPRDDLDLVAVVEELGNAADGDHANLGVVEIPDGIEWEIDDYHGNERVEEHHRSWS